VLSRDTLARIRRLCRHPKTTARPKGINGGGASKDDNKSAGLRFGPCFCRAFCFWSAQSIRRRLGYVSIPHYRRRRHKGAVAYTPARRQLPTTRRAKTDASSARKTRLKVMKRIQVPIRGAVDVA
jgi:hypothetical protein